MIGVPKDGHTTMWPHLERRERALAPQLACFGQLHNHVATPEHSLRPGEGRSGGKARASNFRGGGEHSRGLALLSTYDIARQPRSRADARSFRR